MDYELKRQLVAKLDKKRVKLLNSCINIGLSDVSLCLSLAFDETKKLREDNGEYYTFDEVLTDGHAEGKYCDNCVDAYFLRKGDLSEARQKFGQAKRKIAHLGKGLIAT